MDRKNELNSQPLYASLGGFLPLKNMWVIFDQYAYDNGHLFLLGLNLEGEEQCVKYDEITFTKDNIDYSYEFLASKLKGMQESLNVLQKIKMEKGQYK